MEDTNSKEVLHQILSELNNKNIDFLSKIAGQGYESSLFIYNAAKIIGVDDDVLAAQEKYEAIRCTEELEGEGPHGGIVGELTSLASERYSLSKDICDLEEFPINKALCILKRRDEELYAREIELLALRYRQLVNEECSKLETKFYEGISNDTRAGRIKICKSVVENKLPDLFFMKNKTSLIFHEILFSNWNICLRLVTDNIFQNEMNKVYGTHSTLNATLDIYREGDSDIRNRVTLQFHFIYQGVRPPISHIQYTFHSNKELERLATFYTLLYEMIASEIKKIILRTDY
jgi:hypothetical protein